MAIRFVLDDPFAAGGGAVPELSLDRHGAIIGRSPTVDWSLPDPEKVISSRHCEIDFRGNAYLLVDTSTNGTLVNGARPSGPHTLRDGDVIGIGRYQIRVSLDAERPAEQPAAPSGWGGWDSHSGGGPVGVDPASWDRPAAASEISGRGVMSGQWAPPRATGSEDGWAPSTPAPAPAEPASWGNWSEPTPAATPASAWSSDPVTPGAPAAPDIWGQLAASNVVDWARGGFGTAAATPLPVAATLGLETQPANAGEPAPRSAPLSVPAAGPAPAAASGNMSAALAQAAGLRREDLPDDDALGSATGTLLRRLIAGMVVMLEARTRAKAQMGAAGTALQFDGNNPLKFARTPEQALVQLLREPERGFMPAERAIEDAFVDLQAHQVATLKAMQGALRGTLDRFSPRAIRGRAETKGILARILPGARDAALWHAYEREFSGVAQGSDEAFMDVFAKEFRKAYEEASRRR